MADWRTYAKAARNTARKQAPGARDAARRASERAGDYVRAAGRAVDEGWREDERDAPRDQDLAARREDAREPREYDPAREPRENDPARDRAQLRDREYDPARDRDERDRDDRDRDDRDRTDRAGRTDSGTRTASRPRTGSGTRTASRPAFDTDRLREDAKIYATVAGRRATKARKAAAEANLGGRIMRAFRDALLIGGSLLVIWGVLYAAGILIPFTTVLIAVALIVAISFGTGLYAQSKRAREADPDEE